MKYYIFRVKDNLGQEYYVLNNQYIGYVGFDSQEIRSICEWGAGENTKSKRLTKQFQLFAESDFIRDGSAHDTTLHGLNCKSTRFSKREAEDLMRDAPVFIRSRDKTWYKEYQPSKNSSETYLKEIGGDKTIK